MFVFFLLALASFVSSGHSCFYNDQCYREQVCVNHQCQCPFGSTWNSWTNRCAAVSCDVDQECTRYFANTRCQFDRQGTGSCVCAPSYYLSNSSQACLSTECRRDHDCADGNKVCVSGRCECRLGYTQDNYGDCLRYSCSLDDQCKVLFGGGTYCNRTDATCYCPQNMLIGANSCPLDKHQVHMILAAFVAGLVVMLGLVLAVVCVCCCCRFLWRCCCCCCCRKRKASDIERQPLIDDKTNYYH